MKSCQPHVPLVPTCKISDACYHVLVGGRGSLRALNCTSKRPGSLKIQHRLNLQLRSLLGLLPRLPQRAVGDAYFCSLSEAPIRPTIQNRHLLGKNCSRGVMTLGCTQKVAAHLTWTYSGLDHSKGDSRPGSQNSPKPPLNHLPSDLPAAPAGSKRCDNHPCPSRPPSNRSNAHNSDRDAHGHRPKIVISPAITVPPKQLGMTVPDLRRRPYTSRQPRCLLGSVVLLF